MLVLELLGEVVDDRLVPVVPSQVVVPVRCDDFVHSTTQFEDRDVERPTPEVEHQHGLVGLVVEPVGHRGGSGFVDDPLDLEARDLAGVLRRLTLAVREVCWDGNDGLLDVIAEVLFGVALDLLENCGRDLLGREGLAVRLDVVVLLAHVALDRLDSPIGVLDRLIFRWLAHETLVVGERYHGGRGAVALVVGNDFGIATLHHRERAVGRAEVDTENFVAGHI